LNELKLKEHELLKYVQVMFHICTGGSVMDCVIFQLCTGGSVTDLVQGLKHRNDRLTEEQIAYITKETAEVMYLVVFKNGIHKKFGGERLGDVNI
jgi:hypothetical protein